MRITAGTGWRIQMLQSTSIIHRDPMELSDERLAGEQAANNYLEKSMSDVAI